MNINKSNDIVNKCSFIILQHMAYDMLSFIKICDTLIEVHISILKNNITLFNYGLHQNCMINASLFNQSINFFIRVTKYKNEM